MKTIQVLQNNGLQMSFNQYGEGQNIFLLLHGIPGSAMSWHKVATTLRCDGVKVLVPDLLGFGQSSRPMNIFDLWVEAQANALNEGLRQLGLEHFHLVGHDYGGPVALTLYKQIPSRIRSLTLLATNTFTDTPIPPPLAMIKAPMVGQIWSKLVFSKASLRMMLKLGVGRNSQPVDIGSALGDESQTKSIGIIFESALRELPSRYRSVEETLAQIQTPTTVIWGTKDPFFDVSQGQRTANAIPGAKFILINEAGHFLPEEKPEAVASELKLHLSHLSSIL